MCSQEVNATKYVSHRHYKVQNCGYRLPAMHRSDVNYVSVSFFIYYIFVRVSFAISLSLSLCVAVDANFRCKYHGCCCDANVPIQCCSSTVALHNEFMHDCMPEHFAHWMMCNLCDMQFAFPQRMMQTCFFSSFNLILFSQCMTGVWCLEVDGIFDDFYTISRWNWIYFIFLLFMGLYHCRRAMIWNQFDLAFGERK